MSYAQEIDTWLRFFFLFFARPIIFDFNLFRPSSRPSFISFHCCQNKSVNTKIWKQIKNRHVYKQKMILLMIWWVTTLCDSSDSISELVLTQGRLTLDLEALNLTWWLDLRGFGEEIAPWKLGGSSRGFEDFRISSE